MAEIWNRLFYELIPRGLTKWVTLLCAIITITGIPLGLIKTVKDSEEVSLLVMSIYVCALLSIILIVLVVEEFRWHRKARYAEAQGRLHNAYHRLRDAWYTFHANQPEERIILNMLKDAITQFSNAFSLITGVSCRVCIKDMICVDPNATLPERRYAVKTLVRSTNSDNEAEPLPNDADDFISNNTDFLYLYRNPHKKRFISKNVVKERGYQNSHCNPERNLRSLAYRSVCVWPIRKKLRCAEEGDQQEDDLIAFLCVDSMARNAFSERYDVDLGAAFSDTLYQLLKQIRNSRLGEMYESREPA